MLIAPEFYPAYNDKGRMARFYTEKVLNELQTNIKKEPVFIEKTMVEIRTLGSSDVFFTTVRPKDVIDFPKAWAVFQGEVVDTIQGTAIEKLDGVDRMQAIFYLSKGIRTAEQLADVSDGNISNFGHGAWLHRDAARKHIGWKASDVESKRDDEFKEMQAQLAALTAALVEKNAAEEIAKLDAVELDVPQIVLSPLPIDPIEETEKPKQKRAPRKK